MEAGGADGRENADGEEVDGARRDTENHGGAAAEDYGDPGRRGADHRGRRGV